MQPSAASMVPLDKLIPICRNWGIRELALFGSALRVDFGPESDVDLLFTFVPGRRQTLFERVQMIQDFETALGRTVDLVERSAIEESPNYIRRRQILKSAEVIYAA